MTTESCDSLNDVVEIPTTISIDAKKFNPEILPELKAKKIWVLWRYEYNPNGDKPKKCPYTQYGFEAKSNDSKRWGFFSEVEAVYQQNTDKYDGIGFMLDGYGIVVIDYDRNWKEPVDPSLTYTERSPSGIGYHQICRGKKPGADCTAKEIDIEMYEKGHFMTYTEDIAEGSPIDIIETPELIQAVYNKIRAAKKENSVSGSSDITICQMSDNEVLLKCKSGKDKVKFETLYNGEWEKIGYGSQSEADEALCWMLANHTQNMEQIDNLFKRSGLYRDKWDRSDYKKDTIAGAIKLVNANPFRKYFVEKKFVIKLLADDLMSECKFKTMQDTKEIFIYENGVYKANGRDRILQLAQNKLQNFYNPARCNDTATYIATVTLINRDLFNTSKTIINLKNGLYDLEEEELKPHTPEFLSTMQIPVKHDSNAKCPKIEKFFSEVVSEQDDQVLLEWFGYSMVPDTRMQKAIMLIGEGLNGKGVLLKLLTRFIGAENCSGESLQDLETDKFSVSQLYGKLLNIHADLPSTKISENSGFKQLTGGDRMHGQRKFQDQFLFDNTTRLIFSANEIPSVSKNEFAYFRRWILIQFPHQFKGKADNKNLIYELTTEEELSGLLNLALEAMKGLLEQGHFSYNLSVDEVEALYKLKSNNVELFAEECIIMSGDELEKGILLEAYVKWCKMNCVNAFGPTIFANKLKELGYKPGKGTVGERKPVWYDIALK